MYMGSALSWMTCMGSIELQQGYQWTHVYNSNSENVQKVSMLYRDECALNLTLTFICQVM